MWYEQVSGRESLLLPSPISGGRLPLRILPLHEILDSPDALSQLLDRHRCGLQLRSVSCVLHCQTGFIDALSCCAVCPDINTDSPG